VARIEFWGGVGVIGSSKVLIHDGGHRVLLDLGLDIPRGSDLFRSPAALPRGRELSARLRVGAAPAMAGLYDPAALDPGDPLGETAEPTAVFISHPHIDHVGLAGFLRADIPAYASPDAIALLRALDHSGETLPGPRDFSSAATSWRPVPAGAAVQVGPMRVERLDVDHDVPGASGYRVTTSDGVLAFTGDIRFHGHHPERSWAFADAVAGCDVLVTEGTTLSFDEHAPVRTEADVARDYAAALDGCPDLMLQACYPRDLDRVRAFEAIAAAAGRTILWPGRVAAFLRAAGAGPALTLADAGLAAVRAAPGRFVVQPDPADLPGLLDLPVGPASAMLHANGEPLGPFDPRWPLYADWLAECGLPLRTIGCSGHACADDLHEMLYRIRPSVVVPIHTRSPYRLHPVGGPTRLVVEYARAYDFAGRPPPAGS
jgi:ribonuclease J